MQEIIIIAGPNGAGKTTFANRFLADETDLVFVNADEAARRLLATGHSVSGIDIAAGRAVLQLMSKLARDRREFVVETTLSTLTYARLIPLWQQLGYRIWLNYLKLPSVDVSIDRVRRRVAAGGHSVPEATLRRRFRRSLDNLERIYKLLVNDWLVWNSLEGDFELAEASDGSR